MMKMAVNKNLTKKELQICLLLTLALCVLAAVPLFVMPADWRFTAALAAAQFLLLLPLVYYSQPVLQSGRKTLFGGVPAMEGLVFVCCAAGIISSIIVSINAVHGFISAAAAGFAPLAVLLFTVLVNCYFKQNRLNFSAAEPDDGITADKTAAFVLPAVFAIALAAALSWWFYGLGAAASWQVLSSVLMAAGAGAFMLGNTLPYYFALQNAQNKNYSFENKKTLNNSRKISMAVFDESFANGSGLEITDIITAAVSEAQLLALAASVAETAGHPLREVLKNAAAGLNLPACSGVVMLRGGIAAQCSRKNIRMGTLAFVRTVADVPAAFAKYEAELQKQGKTAYYLTCGRNLQGIIAVGEKVNTNLAPAVQSLQKLGVRTVMFSSGAKHRAEYIGSKAGFDKTVAELSAEHQKELAETFCRTGEFVAVIKRCDDSTALRADIYSPGAVKEGSVVFKDGNAENLAEAIKLSGRLQKMCMQNEKAALWAAVLWAFGAACGWLLLFKTVMPCIVLAAMIAIQAAAIWLNSRRLLR